MKDKGVFSNYPNQNQRRKRAARRRKTPEMHMVLITPWPTVVPSMTQALQLCLVWLQILREKKEVETLKERESYSLLEGGLVGGHLNIRNHLKIQFNGDIKHREYIWKYLGIKRPTQEGLCWVEESLPYRGMTVQWDIPWGYRRQLCKALKTEGHTSFWIVKPSTDSITFLLSTTVV